MSKSIKYGVIGSGKLGLPLSRELLMNDKLSKILLHSESSKDKVLKHIPDELITYSLAQFINSSDFIIIAVNDINLNTLINTISNYDLTNKTIIHTSGIYGLDIFKKLEDKNAKFASAHPFQTFYRYTEDLFEDAPWGIECDLELLPEIESFVKDTSGIPIYLGNISQEQKALYHLTAVIASNTTIALLDFAHEIASVANIDYKNFIPKIMQTTLENVYNSWDNNEQIPLTGPVARGDAEAIKLHLKAMKNNGLDTRAYLALANLTATSAYNHKLINSEQLNEILNIKHGDDNVNS